MRSYLLWMGLGALIALLVYDIKHSVQDSQAETRRLQAELRREQERLHMLQLEWTYLTKPERIARLSERYLDLVPASDIPIHTPLEMVRWSPPMPTAKPSMSAQPFHQAREVRR